jgi:membrane protease YdiL (CAAX protease family)
VCLVVTFLSKGRIGVVTTDAGPALVGALLLLAAVNLANNRLAPRAYVLTSVAGTGALLGLYAWAGTGWDEAGLSGGAVPEGLRWGLAAVGAVAAGYLLAVLVPATRKVFLDRRLVGAGSGDAAYQVLLRIPVGTVLLEEVAFRGVLYALLRDLAGPAWAAIGSCVLFGVWHVLPTLELVRLNPVAGRLAARRAAVASIGVAGLAGAVLLGSRLGSGSLVAPAALHWATNAGAYLTAFVLIRRG